MNSHSHIIDLKARFAAPKSRADASILFEDALASVALADSDYNELQ
jgi:hypothetical protein